MSYRYTPYQRWYILKRKREREDVIVPPEDVWILTTAVWNDAAQWVDEAAWNDDDKIFIVSSPSAGQPARWFDTGVWADSASWADV